MSEIYQYMIFDVSLKKSVFCTEFSRDTFRLGYKNTERQQVTAHSLHRSSLDSIVAPGAYCETISLFTIFSL